MITFLCILSCVIAGIRYKEGEYYNFLENPNPERFEEAVKGNDAQNPAIALSETADLILTDEERKMVLDSRKKPLDDSVKMDELKAIAKERGIEIPQLIFHPRIEQVPSHRSTPH